MTYELDNEGFFEALGTRRRKVTTMTPEHDEPHVATTAGPVPPEGDPLSKLKAALASPDRLPKDIVHLGFDVNALVKARVGELVRKGVAMLGLLLAGVGVGGPLGFAIHEATTVEQTVEKIVKVPVPYPVPGPAAKIGPMKTTCPRCGANLILLPPLPGQTGALPNDAGLKEIPDEPVNEGPGRQGDGGHPDHAPRRVPVPAIREKRPAIDPGKLALVAGPS
jgi:hypothetical protein